MKLKSISFPDIPQLGNIGHIQLASPPEKLRGWTIAVRGPAVFLISPKGWEPGKAFAVLDRTGDQVAFELARSDCKLVWGGAGIGEIDGVAKWTGEPMLRSADKSDEEDAAGPLPDAKGAKK